VPATHPYCAVRNFWPTPPLGAEAQKRSLIMPMKIPEMRVGFLARKNARLGAGRHTLACNRREARGTGQRANCRTVDWRNSKVKNCEPVANQACADVGSTAAHGAFAWATRARCLVISSLRRKPPNAPAHCPSTGAPTHFGTIAGIVTGFSMRPA
jgi:hypothetical protein